MYNLTLFAGFVCKTNDAPIVIFGKLFMLGLGAFMIWLVLKDRHKKPLAEKIVLLIGYGVIWVVMWHIVSFAVIPWGCDTNVLLPFKIKPY